MMRTSGKEVQRCKRQITFLVVLEGGGSGRPNRQGYSDLMTYNYIVR